MSTAEVVMEAALLKFYYGEWIYNPNDGLVYNRRGKAITKKFTNGYRQLSFEFQGKKRYLLAHRVIWTYVRGDIPSGLIINHINCDKSDNRLENLEVVTHYMNTLRASAAGSFRRCIPEIDLPAIRVLKRLGVRLTTMARAYGVNPNHIWMICNGLRRLGPGGSKRTLVA